MRTSALSSVLILGVAGCVHPQTTNELEADSESDPPQSATVVRDVEVGDYDAEQVDPLPVTETPRLRFSSVDVRRTREPVLFRLGAGLGALGHIDLGPCRDEGLPAGYVHMHLTFRRTGRVVRAAVETPTAPPPEALECIGEQIAATMVPVFDGGDVMLSRNFFVN